MKKLYGTVIISSIKYPENNKNIKVTKGKKLVTFFKLFCKLSIKMIQ